MKKKKKQVGKISIEDYIKAVKKADREIQLEQSAGWKRITSVHPSKKTYNRKADKNNYLNE
ncbi:hypothetical protein [Dysgonomonas sp. ZJ279]|uniref:hypothetical protein n=1 Tax=Dysgonomonas sp. ZJ279 TaxID=2709796 RepID=UPI0013EDD78E|nr:hypothetical protein [Dysgonomonas sp. ZJ279]